jgi:hypothetical protein
MPDQVRQDDSITFYETVNIEHPTSNNVFCQFKYMTEQACSAEVATRAGSESLLLIFWGPLVIKID